MPNLLDKKISIQHELETLSYKNTSQDVDARQMMRDFLRASDHIYLNGVSFTKILKQQRPPIDKAKMLEDMEHLDKINPASFAQFKSCLSSIISPNSSDAFYDKLAKSCHQGGLLGNLERLSMAVLANQNLMPNHIKKGMERKIDISSKPSGLEIKETFQYRGDLMNIQHDTLPHQQKRAGAPMIEGQCVYRLTSSHGHVEPHFQSMMLRSSDTKIHALLNAQPTKLTALNSTANTTSYRLEMRALHNTQEDEEETIVPSSPKK